MRGLHVTGTQPAIILVGRRPARHHHRRGRHRRREGLRRPVRVQRRYAHPCSRTSPRSARAAGLLQLDGHQPAGRDVHAATASTDRAQSLTTRPGPDALALAGGSAPVPWRKRKCRSSRHWTSGWRTIGDLRHVNLLRPRMRVYAATRCGGSAELRHPACFTASARTALRRAPPILPMSTSAGSPETWAALQGAQPSQARAARKDLRPRAAFLRRSTAVAPLPQAGCGPLGMA